jgi:hypothetical protein
VIQLSQIIEVEKKMLKYIQARVGEEEFKKIKKKAIDLGITTEEFLKQGALEKIEREDNAETERKEGSRYEEIFDVTLPDQN